MNEQGIGALYEAERRGVRQIVALLTDHEAGYCAVGAIHLAAHGWDQEAAMECKVTSWTLCASSFGGMDETERQEIFHLNDVERRSFSEIARKLGPDSL